MCVHHRITGRLSSLHQTGRTTIHAHCLAARERWHQRRGRRLLTATVAGALAGALSLWWADATLLPAVLLVRLGAYAAHLEATDVRAEVTEPHAEAPAPVELGMG
jgi:uncharacterized membrane protein YfcA